MKIVVHNRKKNIIFSRRRRRHREVSHCVLLLLSLLQHAISLRRFFAVVFGWKCGDNNITQPFVSLWAILLRVIHVAAHAPHHRASLFVRLFVLWRFVMNPHWIGRIYFRLTVSPMHRMHSLWATRIPIVGTMYFKVSTPTVPSSHHKTNVHLQLLQHFHHRIRVYAFLMIWLPHAIIWTHTHRRANSQHTSICDVLLLASIFVLVVAFFHRLPDSLYH